MKKEPIIIKMKNGEPFDIPEDGSLGLLALGYAGLMLWREKRQAIRLKNNEKNNSNEKT